MKTRRSGSGVNVAYEDSSGVSTAHRYCNASIERRPSPTTRDTATATMLRLGPRSAQSPDALTHADLTP